MVRKVREFFGWTLEGKQRGLFGILYIVVLFCLVGFVISWLNTPMRAIYEPNAPRWNCDDDPEGGYFPPC